MPASLDLDLDTDPSPPTFKRPQRARHRRKLRPAPSPPADLTQWRLVNSAAGAHAAGRGKETPEVGERGRAAREAPGEGGGAAAGGARSDSEAGSTGVEPAGAGAWEAPCLWDECGGGGQASAEAAQQDDDEPLSSLTPLTRSTMSLPHASLRRRSAVNDGNVPLSTSRPRPRRATSRHDDDDALPPSLDELYAHVLPKTRRALSRTRTSTKRRSSPSPSSSEDDVPAPPKRKKRLMPPTPPDSSSPSSSWEEHDLPAPDRTVPLKYPLSRHATQPHPHAYLGPDFLGAAQLAALSPRARERLLRPPRAPRLSFGSPPSASVGRARPRASRRRGLGGGAHEPLAVGGDDSESDGGAEGPPRLAAGQAAKGVFLEGVAQTGFFAGGAPAPGPAAAKANLKGEARRERVRLQSVQDLGARFEKRALRDAPREGGTTRRRARARAAGKPRLWLGPEDEAGDVGELDERAAHMYISTARPLPPHRKPGARPPAQPVHFRFAPIRRPPPTQLISVRPVRAGEDPSSAQLSTHDGGYGEAGEEAGSLDEAATNARPSKQRPPSFRFVVGARAKQSSERDLGGWDGGGARPEQVEETPAPRAGGRPGPCTPSSAAPAPQSSGDVFLARHRPLRRMSTYGVSLFGPRHESDPLEDKETPPPRTLEPVVGAPATPQSELQPEQDAHESSHSYRDGNAETPSLPVPARAAAGPTPPRTDPFALVTPSFSFPPAQQHGALPHRLTPSRSLGSTPSFDRSALAALRGTASSPLQAHYPPHLALLVPGIGTATRTSSASTTGLALPIPLRTPYASFRYSSPPLVASVSAVGPTMPDEEEDDDEEERALMPTERLGARAQPEQELEQVPPTSALGPSSPSGAPEHVPSDAFDELDAATGDDEDDGLEVHYTALAVAARTRRALEPARRATVAPPQRKAQAQAQTTAQGVLTPPESTRKPARRGGAARG
ncbi:hypothetical protein JCM9279_000202 [Rhodotorula babjevae]